MSYSQQLLEGVTLNELVGDAPNRAIQRDLEALGDITVINLRTKEVRALARSMSAIIGALEDVKGNSRQVNFAALAINNVAQKIV